MSERIPAGDEKADVRDRLDLRSARWRPLHTRAGSAGPVGPAGADPGPGVGNHGAATVEFAFLTQGDGATYVALRRAGDPDGTVLVFTPSEWDAFLAGVRDGEFDRPEAL
ncbi:DUF397 domain-containing protein [Saccharomonospora iraqiensis]|uniref:DUF397 domain-containing protein n=1 Tax=Saccharomonospora iraqiensis TaxID=52698 RepID=UPI00022E0AB7|nr:DUF397 domain-containing protein [Saccharomonospora iraqiensis]